MTRFEKDIKKALEPMGFTTSKTGSGHIRVLDKKGRTVTFTSSTPRIPREHALDNLMKDIAHPHRRPGFGGAV